MKNKENNSKILKERKSFLILAFTYSIIVLLGVIVFLYLVFYLPLIKNKEIFPKNYSVNLKEKISDEDKKIYGITLDEVIQKSKNIKVYFIDGREIEEFQAAHIKGAFHLRIPDIKDTEEVSKKIGLNKNEINRSFFVIYCHDGTRSIEAVKRINQENFKFLIDGIGSFKNRKFKNSDFEIEGDFNISPFPDYIQNKDFTVDPSQAVKLIKNGGFLVDGRLYEKNIQFPNAYNFRIGQLTSEEYDTKLQKILEQKGKDIIFIGNVYPDLFYAKLIFYRLVQNNGFKIENLKIVFGQDNELYQLLKKEGILNGN